MTVEELDETYNQLNVDGVNFMSTIVSSFEPLILLGLPKEEILCELQPRLALLTALIKLCKSAAPFGMEELQSLLRIFTSSTMVISAVRVCAV